MVVNNSIQVITLSAVIIVFYIKDTETTPLKVWLAVVL